MQVTNIGSYFATSLDWYADLEAVAQTCSVKKVFLEISQRRFPVNFAKFLRTPFLTEHLWWLLLLIQTMQKILRENLAAI